MDLLHTLQEPWPPPPLSSGYGGQRKLQRLEARMSSNYRAECAQLPAPALFANPAVVQDGAAKAGSQTGWPWTAEQQQAKEVAG